MGGKSNGKTKRCREGGDGVRGETDVNDKVKVMENKEMRNKEKESETDTQLTLMNGSHFFLTSAMVNFDRA